MALEEVWGPTDNVFEIDRQISLFNRRSSPRTGYWVRKTEDGHGVQYTIVMSPNGSEPYSNSKVPNSARARAKFYTEREFKGIIRQKYAQMLR